MIFTMSLRYEPPEGGEQPLVGLLGVDLGGTRLKNGVAQAIDRVMPPQ